VIAGLALAFLSGLIALSYEIVWYRAFSFVSAGAADTFGLMLGAYLLGLALGSLAVRRLCRDGAAPAGQHRALLMLTLGSNLAGYLVVPLLAALAARGVSWKAALPLVGVAAAGLGTVFPLAAHLYIAADPLVGRRVSHLYLANILGSTLGSLVTGFVLMDHLGLAAIHVVLAVLGLGLALFVVALRRSGLALVAAGAVAVAAGFPLFSHPYERLQLKTDYRPGERFAHVVETRSGVITVNAQGQIFGGGIYDGAFNTDLHDDKNAIIRCYALAALHPAPRDVLMIGLSSGSWATVIANNPAVERFTIVEINPGYLQLIPKYPDVAGLLANPKVRIEIDDGRRWMVRNRDRRFDAIVANATFHWRSNATNLLSEEYLQLIRSRLKEGGVYYYNTTESARVAQTGCAVFPHALKIGSFLAVSDAPLDLDPARLRELLFDYPRGGKTVFDRSSPSDALRLDEVLDGLRKMVRRRGEILEGIPPGRRIITDDNMGTEWGEGP
jgi:predicted membrane-bound spermidine synthase